MSIPELLVNLMNPPEYAENAIQASIYDIIDKINKDGASWWNCPSMYYGIRVKDFPYPAKNGFFVDISLRIATHRFESTQIIRRDKLFDRKYEMYVPDIYKPRWYDPKDAVRTYSILITSIRELKDPIDIENFGIFNSWGKISKNDKLTSPRLIKPDWSNNISLNYKD